jgi:hypothetical protein
MKAAQDFLIDFANKVGLPKNGTIVLLEREPGNGNDLNWVVTGGGRSDDENAKAVADMRKQHPKIDWSGVKEYDGKWRIIRAAKKI